MIVLKDVKQTDRVITATTPWKGFCSLPLSAPNLECVICRDPSKIHLVCIMSWNLEFPITWLSSEAEFML